MCDIIEQLDNDKPKKVIEVSNIELLKCQFIYTSPRYQQIFFIIFESVLLSERAR